MKSSTFRPTREDERPSAELVAIMTNATRLGFSRSRVATALGLSAAEQAQIEQAIPDGPAAVGSPRAAFKPSSARGPSDG